MVKIFFKMCLRLKEYIPLLSISEMKKKNGCDIKQGFLTFATLILHSQCNYMTANFSHMRLERNRHHIYDGFVTATTDFRYDDEEEDYERKHVSRLVDSLFFSNLISKTGKIKATEIHFWKPPVFPYYYLSSTCSNRFLGWIFLWASFGIVIYGVVVICSLFRAYYRLDKSTWYSWNDD